MICNQRIGGSNPSVGSREKQEGWSTDLALFWLIDGSSSQEMRVCGHKWVLIFNIALIYACRKIQEPRILPCCNIFFICPSFSLQKRRSDSHRPHCLGREPDLGDFAEERRLNTDSHSFTSGWSEYPFHTPLRFLYHKKSARLTASNHRMIWDLGYRMDRPQGSQYFGRGPPKNPWEICLPRIWGFRIANNKSMW
jgi:hypothetical protein